eukprot:TRINITY_DN52090_c0_g1_i1.p1 TRINITY_DN52090_c0_g1~~TRINITY_DN52090_c0_g1_i1.p1  ORF type:complete len:513 (+),score=106.90 TRINITY_DN52090_c0_g1_i1:79-1617(+)
MAPLGEVLPAHEEYDTNRDALEELMRDYGFRNRPGVIPAPEMAWDEVQAISVMEMHMENAQLQEQACICIWRAASSFAAAETIERLLELGGIERICTALTTHCGAEGTVAKGCGALWSIAIGRPKCKEIIGMHGGIEEVCTALVVHPTSVEVQMTGCAALWSLTCNMPNNKAIAASACAVQRVCNTLKVHLPAADGSSNGPGHSLQTQLLLARLALGAMGCICGLPQTRRQVGQFQGIDLVMRALRLFPHEGAVQEQACAALCSIATDDRENQVQILEKGGIELIAKSMSLHEQDELVTEQACAALAALACLPECREVIGKAGIAQQIVAAMRVHSGCTGVQTAGIAAFRNLSLDEDSQAVVGASGGIERICSGMRLHRDHSRIQYQGCAALRSVACNLDNREVAANHGGLELVCRAMEIYKEDAILQAEACAALHNLSCNYNNLSLICKVGGLDRLREALQNFPEDTVVQEEGQRALARLLIWARKDKETATTLALQDPSTLMTLDMLTAP